MRKLLISLILASAAATPALAAPLDPDARQQTRAERQQARDARQQERSDDRQASQPAREQVRAERPGNFAPPAANYAPRNDYAPRYAPGNNAFVRPDVAPRNNGFVRPDVAPGAPPRFDPNRADRQGQRQQFRDDRAAQRIDQRQAVQQRIDQQRQVNLDRNQGRPILNRPHPPVVSPVPVAGSQPPPPTQQRYTPAPQWSTNWRNNSQYDWRNWRNRHRSLFHFGFYYDPFGWGYQPYYIGWRLWPSYYGSNFWLNDPWEYRLPYAPPGTRWVRYYDDALLVDMWSGEVVDVIYDFFW